MGSYTMPSSKPAQAAASPRPAGRNCAGDMDRQVGAKIRQRRVTLGLTQQQLAEVIGITYQEAYKYEKGINRVSAGWLYAFASALDVEVGYFFEGAEAGPTAEPIAQQRLMRKLARNFTNIRDRKYQEALCQLARALADSSAAIEVGPDLAPRAAT
jgi:transcriptional regulator with XRE-family HTH domain